VARISRDGESAVTGFQLLRRLAGRLTLLTLLAVVVGWGLWAVAVSGAPNPMTVPMGGVQPPAKPPPPDQSAVEAASQLNKPPSGPCPNASGYAFDPRSNSCVVLPSCPGGGLIWNPDESKCVPRPPGGALECLDGYGFDAAQDRCVQPNCGKLVFNLQQGKCVPPAPIVATYGVLQFVIGTGDDNLEGYSRVWALWNAPDGTLEYCLLHDGGDGWPSNSIGTVTCDLGEPMTLNQLTSTKISIAFYGISTDGVDEDNWDLRSMTINASGQGKIICIFSASSPILLYRFQNDANKGLLFTHSGPGALADLPATDGIVVTDYPNQCP